MTSPTPQQLLTLEATVRRASWCYLSEEVARSAGLRLADLQRRVVWQFHPSPLQLQLLATRMGIAS